MATAPHELSTTILATSDRAAFHLPVLDNTYGALLLGTFFGLMLYGLTIQQTYRYFRRYPTDIPILVYLVLVILIIETVHTAMIMAACYWHLVSNYFNPVALLVGHWSLKLMIPTSGLSILVCQAFYARRVWYVGHRYRYIVWVAGVLMVALLAFTISATLEGFIPTGEFRRVSWMVSVLFSLAVVIDILLTSSLIFVLVRSRTGFNRTDSTIDVIVVYAINTGLLNSIVGLLGSIFSIILPGNLIWVAISIVGVKLYANSVLAVLNHRQALSERMLEGFEVGSYQSRGARVRPHTVVDTWEVPQFPIDLSSRNTRASFTTPTDIISDDTSPGVRALQSNAVPSSDALTAKMAAGE
ncbi:hypothetical protein BD311DRAFT_507112 [Dichomitus squalens]|uniref:DUF6534 domain-containing protein n=1 Tax=Dichomitus squalens TaxID=114155 RepID=A0A4Q9MD78_9APHY|nr:hypothetical protein BD311DRAFT_507112 [Dichomitus squalens]